MNRRQVETDGRRYTVAPDGQPPLGHRLWGVVGATLVDEITGRPPRTPPFISAPVRGLAPRVAAGGGVVGLVGIPSTVFPNLRNQDYSFDLTLGAAGYLPRRDRVTVGRRPAFPADFTPATLTERHLHRLPVAIEGRLTGPVQGRIEGRGGGRVRVTGVWPTLASLTGPAAPPNLVALLPPLYFPRATGTGVLRRREVVAAPGPDKRLLADAPAGSTALRVSDRVGLAAGDVLWVERGEPERTEYLPITAVAGASTAGQPATVTVAAPTAYAHRAGATVRRCVVQPLPPPAQGFTKHVARPALAGDGVVFLDDLTNIDLATVVEVSGGADPAEYHRFKRFAATSEADGSFRLPPISRLAQVELLARHPQHAALPRRRITLRYDGGANRIDFRFR